MTVSCWPILWIATRFELTTKDIFLALAKEVPNPDGTAQLIANPYQKWSDIRADLPESTIEVLGPPPTSGTRDAFVELAMEGGCKQFAWIKAIKAEDKSRYKSFATPFVKTAGLSKRAKMTT